MKSTEPWSDDYYTFNVQAAMQFVGFESITMIASDPAIARFWDESHELC